MYIYIESYGGISIVGAVFPALYTRVYYGYAREKERGGKGFVIYADHMPRNLLHYICLPVLHLH